MKFWSFFSFFSSKHREKALKRRGGVRGGVGGGSVSTCFAGRLRPEGVAARGLWAPAFSGGVLTRTDTSQIHAEPSVSKVCHRGCGCAPVAAAYAAACFSRLPRKF
jgi:hypothetical protein